MSMDVNSDMGIYLRGLMANLDENTDCLSRLKDSVMNSETTRRL